MADTRYVLAAIVVPSGETLFHWQSTLNLAEREIALNQWRNQATPNIAKLMPGCGIELLMPEAYYVACREADKQIRPASIHAAVHYLTHTLGKDASEFNAIIGSFSEDTGETRTDEYRIGFTVEKEPDVVYGIVWPLYGEEDDDTRLAEVAAAGRSTATEAIADKTPLEQIISLLQSTGITQSNNTTNVLPWSFVTTAAHRSIPIWKPN